MKKLLALIFFIAIFTWGYYYIYNFQTDILDTLLKHLPIFPQTNQIVSKTSRDVTFSSSDGVMLRGTFYPSTVESAPVIVLIHQYQTDRHDFDSFVPTLVHAGYAILAYDTRGFGKSAGNEIDIADFPKDAIGAIVFVKTQPFVNPDKIGIIGASIGANIAFVAAGSDASVKAIVLLSPGVSGVRGQVQNGTNESPNNAFVLSDENEWAEASLIYQKIADPKEQKMYPGLGHGIQLLKNNTVKGDIIKFLDKRLK